jgi:3'-phosphoadenosine 5'-phosphosulfate sulfotransferase (PAPS reductase)/FAD synthetase
MEKNLLVTVSGGRSSAMMARHIQTNDKYKDFKKIYVFCNTGMERYETINFLKDIENNWNIPLIKIEGVYSQKKGLGPTYRLVNWQNIDMTAKPFSELIADRSKGEFKGLPNSNAPYCSGGLKQIPCKKYCDNYFGLNNYLTAIGFRREDMPKRISWAEIKEDKKRIYPLLTDFNEPIGQLELNSFWAKENFKLNLHGKFGNCELCWKKSDHTIIENIRHGTRFVKWYEEQENLYQNTSFRGKKSINYFVEQSKQPYTHEINFETEDKCICNF